MNRTIFIAVVFALLLVTGGAYLFSSRTPATTEPNLVVEVPTTTPVTDEAPASTPPAAKPEPIPTPKPAPTPVPSAGITMAQVSLHAGASSCWSAIGGNVYDLTSFISRHPGGESRILSLCGRDGTASFEAQHGGQGKPEKILASLRVGALAQ